MSELSFYEIHRELVRVRQQMLERDRLARHHASAVERIESIQTEWQDAARIKQQKESEIDRYSKSQLPRGKSWNSRDRKLKDEFAQLVMRCAELETRLEYWIARRVELETRLRYFGEVDIEFGQVRQKQMALLRGASAENIQLFLERCEALAAVEEHIVELHEAITIALKTQEIFTEFAQATRSLSGIVSLIDKMSSQSRLQRLLNRIRPRLQLLKRELWDVGLKFDRSLDVPNVDLHFAQGRRGVQIPLMTLAHIDRIQKAVDSARRKLDRELVETYALQEKLLAERDAEIDRLWRPSLLKDADPRMTEPDDTSSGHTDWAEPILRIEID